MKKLFLTAVTIAITSFTPAFADDTASTKFIAQAHKGIIIAPAASKIGNYKIIVNGKTLNANACTANGCILVPARAVGEALGCTVTWNADRTVTIDTGKMHSTVTIGTDNYFAATSIKDAVGMTAPFTLGAAPTIINNSTYVPVKLFGVLLGNGEDAVIIDGNKINIKSENEEVQIANPLTEHNTVDKLKKAVGFEFKVPSVDEYKISLLQDINKDVAEIRFSNGKNTIHYRVSHDVSDNSGVYNEYENSKSITIDSTDISCKGNGDTVSLATWVKNGCSYSLYTEEGLTYKNIEIIIKSAL